MTDTSKDEGDRVSVSDLCNALLQKQFYEICGCSRNEASGQLRRIIANDLDATRDKKGDDDAT